MRAARILDVVVLFSISTGFTGAAVAANDSSAHEADAKAPQTPRGAAVASRRREKSHAAPWVRRDPGGLVSGLPDSVA